MLRIVIADDSYIVREGTRDLLQTTGEITVVATVGDATELLDAVERFEPGAVLTDIRMPPGHHLEGIEAAHAIRAAHPTIGVVVLSNHADEVYAYELLRHGSAGLAYLLKDRVGDRAELVRALQETASGGSVVDPIIVDAVVARQRRSQESRLSTLTQREVDVLSAMAAGRSNAGVATALNMSVSAVEKHTNSIFAKLGLVADQGSHRRVEAVLTYLRDDSAPL